MPAIDPATADDYVERIHRLSPVLTEQAIDIDAGRMLSPPALDAMHDAALFRLSLPKSIGGSELPVPHLARAAEQVARADASAAWCLGQGLGCAMSAAFLDREAALEVFGPREAVLAWGAGVQGTAREVDGGYLVSGTWRFASGGKHASWLGAHCRVIDDSGEVVREANGKAQSRTALVPREQAEILDDWYVMGLKGTRSEGYTLHEVFVPRRLTLDRESPDECREGGTLYVFPTTVVYASMFSGVALGIAGAMLDDFTALARAKQARGARTSMRDSPVVQTRLAELRGELEATRAYHRQTIGAVWEEVTEHREIDIDQRVRLRLTTTFVINRATEVTEGIWRLTGSDAIFESGPFERRFRDAHAVSQQVQGRFTNYETVGRHMLGLDADSIFV